MTQNPAGETTPASASGRLAKLRSSTFLRHVLTLMTGTAGSQLLLIAASPFIGRLYTDHEYGAYSIIFSLATGIMTIGALRYDMAVVMPREDSDARALVRLSTRLALAVSLAVCLVMTIWATPIANLLRRPEVAPYLPFVGLLVLAMTQISSRQYWLNRRTRYKEMARNRMGLQASTVTTQLGAGVAGMGVLGLVLGSVVGQWFSALNLWRLTHKETAPQAGDSTRKVAVEYKKMPLLNGPNAVVDQVRLQGISLLLFAVFSSAVFGQFAIAWRLLQAPIGLVNGALGQVFYQKLSTTERGRMFQLVRSTMVRSLAIGIIPFGLIWLLSPWIFPFFLGSRWGLAGQIAQTLVPWLYMNFATSPISNLFVAVRRQGVMFIFACFYMAVPLGLIWRYHSSVLQTMSYVSWGMAGLLVIFLLLALLVAKQYDGDVGERDRD
ncbi:lipopolysaccharide biosynthesis protein [Luteococcus sp. Sow4_B9]|uniref:lipopolysaccharide biosynthesis protein n=1 Tax=Luteococcus sp. Sow4_B9 TaxID=3438792 RepID=UPI003F953CCC